MAPHGPHLQMIDAHEKYAGTSETLKRDSEREKEWLKVY